LVGSGLHINAIGGDCPGKTELHRDVLLRSDIFVEYPAQTRIEGVIQQLEPDHPVTELWQVFTGQNVGQRTAKQIALFDSIGFAIEDFSAYAICGSRPKIPRLCHCLMAFKGVLLPKADCGSWWL
tara:strand:+ start:353 stop:727 length:375 start_codon:yes stop_codon:yes gene_type:complete